MQKEEDRASLLEKTELYIEEEIEQWTKEDMDEFLKKEDQYRNERSELIKKCKKDGADIASRFAGISSGFYETLSGFSKIVDTSEWILKVSIYKKIADAPEEHPDILDALGKKDYRAAVGLLKKEAGDYEG